MLRKQNIVVLLLFGNILLAQKPNIVWIVSEDNSKHFMQTFDSLGAPTPNIQSLANEGLVFHNAFSNSPVCSAARSTLISGCYGPRLGTHYHRKKKTVSFPATLEPWPKYLRNAGYYTTNNSKKDYNIRVNGTWDESSKNATWRNRTAGQPFFHVQNYMTSHESKLHNIGTSGTTKTEQETVFIPPMHPNTDLFKYSYARYHDRMMDVDNNVKLVMDKLKKDGLLENTFIFYYGDHGGVLPGSKGFVFETGLNVPLVVRIPENFRNQFKVKAGTEINGFVSFVDFGATVLHLAGLEIPDEMDGSPFLGSDITLEDINKRDSTFSYADRHDEKYDMVRAYRKGKYKYIRNYQPFNFNGLFNEYRYKMAACKQWRDMFENDELNKVQSAFFLKKQPEALYDIEADPYETNNLADKAELQPVLNELRNDLTHIVKNMPDLGFYPEPYLIENAFDNPVGFGQTHKKEIQQLVDISNLSLYPFESGKPDIISALNSENEWFRYWGLIVCSSHLTTDNEIITKAEDLVNTDNNILVRMRAAEYLALIGNTHPGDSYLNILSKASVETEALLILNSVVMLMDGEADYLIEITPEAVHPDIRNSAQIKKRLNYIKQYLVPLNVGVHENKDNMVLVSWETKGKTLSRVKIERSFNNGPFTEVAKVGHSDMNSYTDTLTKTGAYKYRLIYFNENETMFKYSNTVLLDFKKNTSEIKNNTLDIPGVLVYPNPITDNVLNISAPYTPKKIDLYSLQGVKLKSIAKTKQVPVNDLAPGVYWLVIDEKKPIKVLKNE